MLLYFFANWTEKFASKWGESGLGTRTRTRSGEGMDRAERRNDEHPKGDPTEREKKKWFIEAVMSSDILCV